MILILIVINGKFNLSDNSIIGDNDSNNHYSNIDEGDNISSDNEHNSERTMIFVKRITI